MGNQPQVSLDRIRQTSTASRKKIGLDTNQALLGSERSHSRSAWLMAHHLQMGCSSLPEGRLIVMLQVNKCQQEKVHTTAIFTAVSGWIIYGENNYLPKITRYNAIAKPLASSYINSS